MGAVVCFLGYGGFEVLGMLVGRELVPFLFLHRLLRATPLTAILVHPTCNMPWQTAMAVLWCHVAGTGHDFLTMCGCCDVVD